VNLFGQHVIISQQTISTCNQPTDQQYSAGPSLSSSQGYLAM